jgi:hypothetical protein
MLFKLLLENFSKRSSDYFNLFSSASTVSKSMVFSNFKESIKTCDSDNCKIKDYFSCLILLSFLLDFLKSLLINKVSLEKS